MSLVVDTRAQPLKEADLPLGEMKPLSCLSSPPSPPLRSLQPWNTAHSRPLQGGGRVSRSFPFSALPCRRQRSHLNLLMLQRTDATPVAAGQVWPVSHGLSLPASSVEM